MAKKINLATAPTVKGTLYPPPFDEPCLNRSRVKLGDAAGLTQFGVNLCTLPPGTWSSQRHWHTLEDELIYVISGEVVLVTDSGEEILKAGDSAGFKAGVKDGHTFQNRSSADAVIMEIGTRLDEDAAYHSDIDLVSPPGPVNYTHRDGTPYPARPRAT